MMIIMIMMMILMMMIVTSSVELSTSNIETNVNWISGVEVDWLCSLYTLDLEMSTGTTRGKLVT